MRQTRLIIISNKASDARQRGLLKTAGAVCSSTQPPGARSRRDDENALITKNQAEAKTQLAQLETERQTTFQGRMQANREKEQVKMEQMAAENESPNPWERVVSLVDLQADAVAAAGDTSRMRQVFIQMKNSAKASA